jgi:hypothetical protein
MLRRAWQSQGLLVMASTALTLTLSPFSLLSMSPLPTESTDPRHPLPDRDQLVYPHTTSCLAITLPPLGANSALQYINMLKSLNSRSSAKTPAAQVASAQAQRSGTAFPNVVWPRVSGYTPSDNCAHDH